MDHRRGTETGVMNPAGEVSRARNKGWIGYVLAAACLVWVFHDLEWKRLFASVTAMNWWLLLPAAAADAGSYVTQGARWSLLLRPLGRLPPLKATQAIYAALFTNEVLPLRMGEVLRGYLASRWMPLPMTQVFSSIFVERFVDGVWMALAFGVVVLAAPLPRYLVDAEEALAAVIFAVAALFFYLIVRKRPAGRSPGGGAVSRLIGHATAASASIGSARTFYGAVALSGLLLVLQALSFWLVMEAYGLSLSIWQGGAVFLIVHLGTMIPSAPSNIGTYQFFTVLGLMLFGVDKTAASGFSVVVFLILTIPLWIIGLAAFGRAGLSLRMVRDEVAKVRQRWQRRP